MIQSALYREPVLLDPVQHRTLRMAPLTDFSVAGAMHGAFLAVSEFAQAGMHYPIVFVATGEDGQPPVWSPIALLGLAAGENLFVEGTRWEARYVPAFVRRYPFLTANIKGEAGRGVMADLAWSGFAAPEGEPLFGADGAPAPALKGAIEFLERFEVEAQRTRQFCALLAELDVLQQMQADATLPDGEVHTVDGFWAVDERRLAALPEARVMEIHRNGMLGLLHVHLASLANLQWLVERKAMRRAVAQGQG